MIRSLNGAHRGRPKRKHRWPPRCVCGCLQISHEHYSRSTRCAACGFCPRWRRKLPWRAWAIGPVS